MKDWSIKKKLILSFILLGVIPVMILGPISYYLSRNGFLTLIGEKLQLQVATYKEEISHNLAAGQKDLAHAREMAQKIVAQQASLVDVLISRWNPSDLEGLKRKIGEFKVGKSGYIFVLS